MPQDIDRAPVLRLLGPPSVRVGGNAVSIGAKPLALLVYLSFHPEPQPRERLANLLWSESSRSAGLHSLSQAVYAIKKLCGSGAVIAAPDSIQIGEWFSDYERYSTAKRRALWIEAASEVGGALCEGFTSGALPFDHWLEAKRTDFLSGLAELLHPLELSFAWDQLIRLCALLRVGLGPGAELDRVQRTAEKALHQEQPTSEPHVGEATSGFRGHRVFVGRVAELRLVSEIQHRVSCQRDRAVVVVSGPPGIGKTALCDRVARLSVLRDWKLLRARGYPAESNLPLGVVEQLLTDGGIGSRLRPHSESWSRILTGAFPSLRRDHADAGAELPAQPVPQIQVFEAVRRALLATAGTRPLIIATDDFHFCDPSSSTFFHHLYRGDFAPGLILLLACSTDALSRLEDEYEEAHTITLGGLDRSEVAAFLDRMAPSGFPASLETLHAQTGGNPLLLESVISQLIAGGKTTLDSPIAGEYFRKRFEALDEDAKLLFASIAVLGGTGRFDLASTVAELDGTAAARAVMQLVNSGLVSAEHDSITLVHGLAGDILLSDLPAVVTRLLYARAAKELRASNDSPAAVLAVQLDIAGERKQTFQTAKEAACSSLRLSAYREADFFLRLSLSHAQTSTEVAETRLALADLYSTLGRQDQILEVLAWDGWADATRQQQLWRRAYSALVALSSAHRRDDAIDGAWECVEAVAEEIPAAAARVLGKILPASVDLGRLADAREAAYRLIDLLPRLPSDLEPRYRGGAAATLALTESLGKARSLLEDLYTTATAPPDRIHYLGASSLIAFGGGDLQKAETELLAGIALCEEGGIYSLFHHLLNNLSVCYLEMGQYRQARECLKRAKEPTPGGREREDEGFVLMAYDNLSHIAYEEGNYELCLEYALRAAEINKTFGSRRSTTTGLGIRGLANLQLGRLPDAFECERELRQIEDRRRSHVSDISYVEIFVARIHMLRGRDAEAEKRLEDAIAAYKDRDVLGRARLQIELLRLRSRRAPGEALREARGLEAVLERSGARPLLAQLRAVIAEIPS